MPVYWFLIMVTVHKGLPSTTVTPMPSQAVCSQVLNHMRSLGNDTAIPNSFAANGECYSVSGIAAAPSTEKPASMTEKDAIRAHIERFWNVPDGAKDSDKLVVYIRVSVLPDGTVTDAQVQTGDPTMTTNPYYQTAADSARRAVRAASPLPIPSGKYDQFKSFTLAFSPKFQAAPKNANASAEGQQLETEAPRPR